ncbi:MAG: DUF533 domain-containing protein [Acidobacteriota bacterium]
MGLLSGLVNSMIKESTGYDARKITRLVGGKNLMMLAGGAALAGGVASAMQPAGGGTGASAPGVSQWDAPRGPAPQAPPAPPMPAAPVPAPVAVSPRPPVPGAAPPAVGPAMAPPAIPMPSPPPAAPPAVPPAAPPTIATVEPEADIADSEPELPAELTFAIVRAMVAASLADGRLDEAEKKLVLERIEDSGLPLENKQQVHRDLVLPPSPADIAAMVPEAQGREAIYRMAGVVVLADGEVSDLERGFLDRLARALDFDDAAKAELEAQIFA